MKRAPVLTLIAVVTAAGGRSARADLDPRFPDLAAIDRTIEELAAAHPSATALALSDAYALPTSEGRQVRALSLGRGSRAVLVVAGLHGRELAPPIVALHLARTLIDGDGLDPAITALLDRARVHIAPMWNPDGYAYVRTDDSRWRKNRAPHGAAIGVDLNRNFDAGWDGGCAGDTDPDSRFYKGPDPASEQETRLMTAWSADAGFEAVIDLHAAGRQVVVGSPCGDNRSELDELAVELAERLGYGGAARRPAADGELHQWHAERGAPVALLIELGADQQPSYDDAVAEADAVTPGLIWALGDHPARADGCRATGGAPSLPVALGLIALTLGGRRRRRPRRGGRQSARGTAARAASPMRAGPDRRRAPP